MNSERLEVIQDQYQSGLQAFESGQYRQSVEYLEKASALVERNSALGGEIQIWLVSAYQASGRIQEAIALCRSLSAHPHRDTRATSRRLLYILEAPKLETHPEWVTNIPDLSKLEDSAIEDRRGTNPVKSKSSRPRRLPEPKPEPIDWSQVKTEDNGFIWLALLGILVVLGGLAWFA
ncbi:MAG: tetratricopeptide repeat protein [Cyanobacteriota bacterium]|nr:tetratricopeptide repeat protein [Cyanobacteriota bacterium]